MYLIKGNFATETTKLFPAESCIFMTEESADNKSYEVTYAVFHNHGGNGGNETILNPILGYISKTGRFVEITS
jgi:hypothetical protein